MENQSEANYDFDKLADSYDKWYDSAAGRMYDRLEKKAFDSLVGNHNNGKQLLEIGCGTGHWSRYFSDKGFEITGIDISAKMIKIANKKNIPHCRFQTADGQNLSFFDNSFDAAAAITVLEFSKNPEKIISEMVRCVKPKGRLLLGVLNSLSAYNQKRQKNINGVYAYGRLFSPRQLKNLLERFGAVKMQIAGFVLRNKRLIWLSPFWEFLCHIVNSKKGAFIVVEVQL
jgi:ubiquinone/menaquinone biosynthesis C-methylase UbiE